MTAKIMPYDKKHPGLGIKELCDWFLNEQEEEEESVSNVIELIETAEKQHKPVNLLDLEIYFLKKED